MSFDRTIRHCRQCGHPVAKRLPDDGDTRERDICTVCHTVHYINPLNVVGTVPWLGERVLLCKRNIEPRWGKWTLPAGFMELGETAAEGAARETREEAGARIELEGLFAVLDAVRPYATPRGLRVVARVRPDAAPGARDVSVAGARLALVEPVELEGGRGRREDQHDRRDDEQLNERKCS